MADNQSSSSPRIVYPNIPLLHGTVGSVPHSQQPNAAAFPEEQFPERQRPEPLRVEQFPELSPTAGQHSHLSPVSGTTEHGAIQRQYGPGAGATMSTMGAAAAPMVPLFHQSPPPPRMSHNYTDNTRTVAQRAIPYHAPLINNGVGMRLCNRDLWQMFHVHVNEMIITKTGRRMFPNLKISLAGLDPDKYYEVFVDMELSHKKNFKFRDGSWTTIDRSEIHPPNSRIYLHSRSPKRGQHWMQQDIVFDKLKLTNNRALREGFIVLKSMHMYQPRIYVIECGVNSAEQKILHTHSFPETEFIAVTAYQNTDITQLKIEHNPFAKGFQDIQSEPVDIMPQSTALADQSPASYNNAIQHPFPPLTYPSQQPQVMCPDMHAIPGAPHHTNGSHYPVGNAPVYQQVSVPVPGGQFHSWCSPAQPDHLFTPKRDVTSDNAPNNSWGGLHQFVNGTGACSDTNKQRRAYAPSPKASYQQSTEQTVRGEYISHNTAHTSLYNSSWAAYPEPTGPAFSQLQANTATVAEWSHSRYASAHNPYPPPYAAQPPEFQMANNSLSFTAANRQSSPIIVLLLH